MFFSTPGLAWACRGLRGSGLSAWFRPSGPRAHTSGAGWGNEAAFPGSWCGSGSRHRRGNGRGAASPGTVLAVQGYSSTSSVTLIDATTGAVLATIATGTEFGQPVFADDMLLIPTQGKGLWAYR